MHINFPDVKKKLYHVKRLFGQVSKKKRDNSEHQRCILGWRDDVHVDPKPFKYAMKFHIRRYERDWNGVLIPTEQWVTLDYSRCLILEQQIWYLENSLEKSLNDQLEREYKVPSGGNVYTSVSPKYLTVDLHHF